MSTDQPYVTKVDMKTGFQRLDLKIDHVVKVLEKKIDHQTAELTETIAAALEYVPTRPEFDSLASRVTRLERKIG